MSHLLLLPRVVGRRVARYIDVELGTIHRRCFVTCDAQNRIALWNEETGERIRVFERRGFEAGQTAAGRASQQQMDQVNGHTGPVNGCLFLPTGPPPFDSASTSASASASASSASGASATATIATATTAEGSKANRGSRAKETRPRQVDGGGGGGSDADADDGDEEIESDLDFNSDETLSSSSSEESSLSPSSDDDEEEEEEEGGGAAAVESKSTSTKTIPVRTSGQRRKRLQKRDKGRDARTTGSRGRSGGVVSEDEDDEAEEEKDADPDAGDMFRLLSWSADGTIKLWGMSSGKVLETLTGHGAAVTHVSRLLSSPITRRTLCRCLLALLDCQRHCGGKMRMIATQRPTFAMRSS